MRNWKQVAGHGVSGAINIITRTAASGTADAFQNIFMTPAYRIAGSAVAKQSNGLVAQAVRSDPHAIGFVSFDFIRGTHAVSYQGVPCTLRNAKSGQYQGVRNFWMITRGAATGVAKAIPELGPALEHRARHHLARLDPARVAMEPAGASETDGSA